MIASIQVPVLYVRFMSTLVVSSYSLWSTILQFIKENSKTTCYGIFLQINFIELKFNKCALQVQNIYYSYQRLKLLRDVKLLRDF